MITDAEFYSWIVLAIIAVVVMFIILPLYGRYLDYKENRRMFAHYEYTEYHDDMEDLGY